MSALPQDTCNICGHTMVYVSTARVLAQHDVRYYSCPNCFFLRTEKPYWLQEAYSRAIAATDTGIVLRNLKIARQLTCILPRLFAERARFVDVAGGTGLLTRLMRDNGFDFFWEDVYCQNVLAFGFDASTAGGYDAVTAFEVLEHLEEPLEFIRSCVERSASGTFIFTTELFLPPLPANNWWYFSWATGQHISFFSAQTLQRIAQLLQVRFLSHRGLHLFTRMPIAEEVYKRTLDEEEHGLFDKVSRSRTGFAMTDHIDLTTRVMRSKGASEMEIAQFVTQATGFEPREQFTPPLGVEASDARGKPRKDGWMGKRLAKWKRKLRKRIGRGHPPDSFGT